MKGQSAIEFLSLISLSALIMAALYGMTLTKQGDISMFRETQTKETIADRYSFQVEMALVQGEGYSRVFSLPSQISGEYYNLSVGKSKIMIEHHGEQKVETALYDGDWVNVSTRKGNVYKVLNNGSIHVIQEE